MSGNTGNTRRQGPKRSEASRAAILQATRDELAEAGWRKFSVDNVARRAQASKQTIYRWWPSIGTMCVEAGLALIPAATSPVRDPLERVTALVQPLEAACRAGTGHAVLHAALMAASDDEEARNAFKTWMTDQVRQPLRLLLAEFAAKQVVRRDWVIDDAVEALFGGFWHRLLVMRAPISEGYARTQAERLLDSLAPR